MTKPKTHILYGRMPERELIRRYDLIRSTRKYKGGHELNQIEEELTQRRLKRLSKTNPEEYNRQMLEEPTKKDRKIPLFRGLTAMQEKFCMEFSGHGDEVKAYTIAGYNLDSTEARTRARARHLLKDEKIAARIKEYQEEAIRKIVWDKNRVLEKLAEVHQASMIKEDYTNANKSMEHIAKHLGMFVDKVEQTVKTTGFETGDKKKDIQKLADLAGFELIDGGRRKKEKNNG
tara:strand:- start:693 stop:1388 length:696 start_codon:yes stop_codon:yes gene_type:complete